MFRRAAFLMVTLSLVLAGPAPALAQEENPLKGAWLVEQVNPADGEPVQNPRPAMFLVTDHHYSFTVVPGEKPRSRLPELEEGEEPSQEQKLQAYEAYERFISNAGRYQVQGDSLTLTAYVAKHPNYMQDYPDNANTVAYSVEGETLKLHFGAMVVKWRQVDHEPMSY